MVSWALPTIQRQRKASPESTWKGPGGVQLLSTAEVAEILDPATGNSSLSLELSQHFFTCLGNSLFLISFLNEIL